MQAITRLAGLFLLFALCGASLSADQFFTVPQGSSELRILYTAPEHLTSPSQTWDTNCTNHTTSSGSPGHWTATLFTDQPAPEHVYQTTTGDISYTDNWDSACTDPFHTPPTTISGRKSTIAVLDVSGLAQNQDVVMGIRTLGHVLGFSYSIDGPVFGFDTSIKDLGITDDPRLKVLTHRYGTGDAFFSTSQVEFGPGGAHDRAYYRIKGLISNPGAVNQFYLKLIDPPDTAPYVPSPALKDNFDADAKLVRPDGSSAAVGSPLEIVDHPGGEVLAYLAPTQFASGDNYRVIASFDEPNSDGTFPCEASSVEACPETGTITAWKREYVERHDMWRGGSFITEAVCAGLKRIFVDDISQFTSGDTAFFMHSPDSVGAGSFAWESHVIDVVPANATTGVAAHLELRGLDILSHGYGPSLLYATRGVHTGDAVGLPSKGIFEAVTDRVPGPFADSFVDVRLETPAVPYVPFLQSFSQIQAIDMFARWWEHRDLPNHQILVGASRDDVVQQGALMGVTLRPYSMIYVGRIESAVTESVQPVFNISATSVNEKTTVHELVHQWTVNPNSAALNVSNGHCLGQWWQHVVPQKFCLMHAPFFDLAHNGEWGDHQVVLHYEPAAAPGGQPDSEYITIRRQKEPIPH